MTDPISLMIRKPPRVWSLIVTLFGDLAPEKHVSGALLGVVMDRAGVKPEATRVALHRLRKEDWIVSERAGRTSRYRLSENGRQATRAATPRIYDLAPRGVEHHALWIADPDGPPIKGAELLHLSPHMAIGTGDPPLGVITQPGAALELPRWARLRLCPPELARGYADLDALLAAVLETPLPQGALEQTALRVLVVHAWRRLALRHAAMPDAFWPREARAVKCRKSVVRLLEALPRHDLETLT